MADNDVFNTEKPSKLKTAFQYAGAVVSTINGDGPDYGWNQLGLTYDYAKTWLGSKGFGLGKNKPAAA